MTFLSTRPHHTSQKFADYYGPRKGILILMNLLLSRRPRSADKEKKALDSKELERKKRELIEKEQQRQNKVRLVVLDQNVYIL